MLTPRGCRSFLLLLCCASRSDKGKRHQMPEAKLQEACVKWLHEKNFLFVASAVTQYKNGARTAASLKRRGVEAGVPDLLILESSPYICGGAS